MENIVVLSHKRQRSQDVCTEIVKKIVSYGKISSLGNRCEQCDCETRVILRKRQTKLYAVRIIHTAVRIGRHFVCQPGLPLQ